MKGYNERMETEARECQKCKERFTIDAEDRNFYEQMDVPPPTFCPTCRTKRRMAFWNERNLYRRKDSLEGKEVFSTYPEHAPLQIYEHDYWWSDAWDPMSYGRDYDFSRPFFEQWRDLLHAVPRASREIKTLVDSDYCDNSNNLKNCYLCFDGSYCEDCLYSTQFSYAKNSIDVTCAGRIDQCYEIISSDHCFQTFFAVNSRSCRTSWFLRDCEDCDHCFGCVNLRHKQYHIFNVPYSKEEYTERIKALNTGSYQALQDAWKKTRELWSQHPNKYIHGQQNATAVGDYVSHSKNVRYSYEIYDSANIAYSQRIVWHTADTHDTTGWGDNSQLMYESAVCGEDCERLRFCMFCWPADRDLEYCASCHSSSSLFGCIGLRKKQYCILNKQYSKEEYEDLRRRIIEHMSAQPYHDAQGLSYKYGEFPPAELSPLAYNETVAMDYFPMTKEEVLQEGFAWRDPDEREYKITVVSADLPDHITEATDTLTKEIIGCASCKRAYRILPQELEFYRRFEVPLPRLCHTCRHRDRLALRNPMRWYERTCQCAGAASADGTYKNVSVQHEVHTPAEHCSASFETTYAPNRPDIVYCEKCYNAEVV